MLSEPVGFFFFAQLIILMTDLIFFDEQTGPRLLQISSDDPFFNSRIINFETMQALEKVKDHAEVESSWKALIHMMVRSDTSTTWRYHASDGIIKAAIFRLHSLIVNCLDPLHKDIKPPTDISTQKEDTQLFEMAKFVTQKVCLLATNTSTSNSIKGNGLHFVLKRIWETLSCLVIMHYSEVRQAKLDALKRPVRGGGTKSKEDAVALKKKDSEIRDMWRSGPGGMEPVKWGKHRLCCLGSAMVFFAFGPTGWWTAFCDQNRFNTKSVWGMANLARIKHLTLKSATEGRRNQNPFNPDRPWKNVETLVWQCIEMLDIHVQGSTTRLLDWGRISRKWSEVLSES